MEMKRKLSQLGADPWECIIRKLPFPDVLRFKRVCRSWSSMVENYVSSSFYRFRTPWLLLPDEEEDEDEEEDGGGDFGGLSFYNLDEKKRYRNVCVCGEVQRGRCIGSSHGCFILVDKKANVSIFNPFSDDGWIAMGSLEFTDSDDVANEPRSFVHKAAMICNNKNRDIHGAVLVVLVLIYGRKGNLAFSRYSDDCAGDGKKFIELPGAHPPYEDVVCNAETNTVSAISDRGSVQVWDLNFSTGSSSSSLPRKIMDVAPPFPATKTALSERKLYSAYYYMVESGGELLFILRSAADYFNRCDDLCGTQMFNVYRLDRNEKWVEIQSLGDRVVFIGGNESFYMRAEDCPGCRKDSIYFTDSYWEGISEFGSIGGHDIGCYCLTDQSFDFFYDHWDWECNINPLPMWLLPNPSSIFLEDH